MRPTALAVALTMVVSAVAIGQTTQETVYEPGNGVSLPRVVKEVKPQYPPEVMRNGVRGTVIMKCVVGRDGRPGDITVERSLEPQLDEAAVDALKQWEFKAGTKDGKAVAVRVSVEMTFTLK